MTNFSIVVPMKDEIQKLKLCLPLLCKLRPSEILICTDHPTPKEIYTAITEILDKLDYQYVRVIPVKRRSDYLYHQAWVRRCGFLMAKNDIILTVDIDLLVTSQVLKGLKFIGKNNVGVVTFAKFRRPEKSIISFLRLISITFCRYLYNYLFQYVANGQYFSGFSGLYLVYRPYWLITEGNSIKKLIPPLGKEKKCKVKRLFNIGEDVHLVTQMRKEYKVKYIARIGAKVISYETPFTQIRQSIRGKSSAITQRSMISVIMHSIIYVSPNVFKIYLQTRRQIQK